MEHKHKMAMRVADELPLDEYSRALPETILLIIEIIAVVMDMVDECREDRPFGVAAHEMVTELMVPDGSFLSRLRLRLLYLKIRRQTGRKLFRQLGGIELMFAILHVGESSEAAELETLHSELCDEC